jgi:hypothetical protein
LRCTTYIPAFTLFFPVNIGYGFRYTHASCTNSCREKLNMVSVRADQNPRIAFDRHAVMAFCHAALLLLNMVTYFTSLFHRTSFFTSSCHAYIYIYICCCGAHLCHDLYLYIYIYMLSATVIVTGSIAHEQSLTPKALMVIFYSSFFPLTIKCITFIVTTYIA